MTRCIRLSPSLVRFAPVGIDAATGDADDMLFTTERRGALNIIASSATNATSLICPAGVVNPFVIGRFRVNAVTGSGQTRHTPVNPNAWVGFSCGMQPGSGYSPGIEIEGNSGNPPTFWQTYWALVVKTNPLRVEWEFYEFYEGSNVPSAALDVDWELKLLNYNL